MSDCWFNLRILFWHIQGTTYGTWRVSFNSWLWENKRLPAFIAPIVLFEFDWKRRKSDSIENHTNKEAADE